MKRNIFISSCLGLTSLICVSCSSEEIGQEPFPNYPSPRTVALRFRIGHQAFTKADDGENVVENVVLSFYHSNNGSPLFLQNVAAVKDDDGLYSVNLEVNPTKEPDLVLAYINTGLQLISQNVSSITNLKLDNFYSEAGNFIMTTPRFFDKDGNDKMFQSIDCNSSQPITLEFERIASKVIVSSNSPSLSPISLKKLDGSTVTLSLNLSGWALSATDKSSYLIRNIGNYQEMSAELKNWNAWNDYENCELYWAYSVNYQENPDANLLNNFKASQSLNSFGEPVFSIESTRPINVASAPNTKPSVVLVGYYTQDSEETPSTFFKYSSFITNEEELMDIFINKISKKVKIKGSSPTKSSVSSVFEIKKIEDGFQQYPTGSVSLQAKTSLTLSEIITVDGKSFSDISELNSYLIETCGIAEMYKDGKCYFTFPIEHYKNNDITLYGIVRNNLYKIALTSISGMGGGIADDDQVLGDQPEFEDDQNQCNISFTLSIREWNEVEQNVTIEKK